MAHLLNKKTIPQKMMIVLIIMLLIIGINQNVLYAEYKDGRDDNLSPFEHSKSISAALKSCENYNISRKKLEEVIKTNIRQALIDRDYDEDTLTDSVYDKCKDNSQKIAIKFGKNSMEEVGFYSLIFNLTDADINTIKNGGEIEGPTVGDGSYISDKDLMIQEGRDEGFSFGDLFRPVLELVKGLGDAANKILCKFIIGDTFFSDKISVMGPGKDVIQFIEDNPPIGDDTVEEMPIVQKYITNISEKNYYLPIFRLTPAEIFSGKVSCLNANFFSDEDDYKEQLGGEEKSIVKELKGTIAQWYVALRNIAITGLICVLLYIGIKIVISSSANEKAKYKEYIIYWIEALGLILALHFGLSFAMFLSENITGAFAGTNKEPLEEVKSNQMVKQVNVKLIDELGNDYIEDDKNICFSTNFTGLARIKADYKDESLSMGYTVIYVALTVYTIYFTYIYLKRLLMLAFFTMIAPLVALTYPLDKMGDTKAQALNYWAKEYVFYAFLQPFHMLLYTVFVSSTIKIASNNLIFAIITLSFIVPAEKIIKQMFGIKGNTESTLGGFAGGMIASRAFDMIGKGKKRKSSNNSNNSANNKPRMNSNPNSKSKNMFETIAEGGSKKDIAKAAAKDVAKAGIKTAGKAGKLAGDVTGDLVKGKYIGKNPETGKSQVQVEGKKGPGNVNQEENLEENSIEERSEKPKFKDRFATAVSDRWKAAGGGEGITKRLAKGTLKGYGKLLTMGTMGAIGLGSGIVGGNMSDTLKGMGAGLVSGNIVGNRMNSAIENTVSGNNAVGDFLGEVILGREEFDKKKFEKEHVNNNANIERVVVSHPEFSMEDIRKQLKQEADFMFDSQISDMSTVKAAVKMENKLRVEMGDNAHDYTISLAQLGQNYGNSTFLEEGKFEKAQKALKERLEEQLKDEIEQQLRRDNRRTEKEIKEALNDKKDDISQQANQEATNALNRIREMKKL